MQSDVEEPELHRFEGKHPNAFVGLMICIVVTPKGRKSTPKQILFDISGEAKAGEILAIMGEGKDERAHTQRDTTRRVEMVFAFVGSTGAGKSTLLDCLAGRKSTGALTGELLVNGASRPDTVGRVTAYVLQDDQVLGLLTVRETLLFSAQLRLGAHEYTEDERVAKVDELIEALGLENVQDSLVGTTFRRGISGGEKKRLCVAVELVTDPSILFCDEPTSKRVSHTLCESLTNFNCVLLSNSGPGCVQLVCRHGSFEAHCGDSTAHSGV